LNIAEQLIGPVSQKFFKIAISFERGYLYFVTNFFLVAISKSHPVSSIVETVWEETKARKKVSGEKLGHYNSNL
jgi:hypothetical protein